MARPTCAVNIGALPSEEWPHFASTAGLAGTNRHFHTVEEECSYVLAGCGNVRIGPLRVAVSPGHFIGFPPGLRPHHFINDGTETLVLLDGGERRRSEDGGWFPDVRKNWRTGRFVSSYEEPLPEVGDESQIVHVEDVDLRHFQHDVDRSVHREMRSLHSGTGLHRVHWVRVAAGVATTAFHSHERTEEWVFILTDHAIVRVGDEIFEVGPDDFVGHPALGAPHVMEAVDDLIYLMGGQIDAGDIVTYLDAGLRRVGAQLQPISG